MKHDLAIGLIGELAASRGRCVSRQLLLEHGIRAGSIKRLRRRRFLIDVFRGTYAVGVPQLTHAEFRHACVLHAGPEAYPSHRTGLELRGIVDAKPGFVTVTTRRGKVETPVRTVSKIVEGGYGTLTVHESTVPLAVERIAGLQTTLLTRTLVDFAATESPTSVRRAWREATFQSLLDPDALRADLDADPRAGNTAIRERLKNAYPVVRPGIEVRSRSGELEFLGLVRELGLPQPLVNHRMTIGGKAYVADFYFEAWNLVVETDGSQHELAWHREDDRVRAVEFYGHGIAVLHISNERLAADRPWCAAQLLATARRHGHLWPDRGPGPQRDPGPRSG